MLINLKKVTYLRRILNGSTPSNPNKQHSCNAVVSRLKNSSYITYYFLSNTYGPLLSNLASPSLINVSKHSVCPLRTAN